MTISSFDDLLLAACQQPLGQRLLLVFAKADLPEEATPSQLADFNQGCGGELVPAMYVDKTPDEIGNFEQLRIEADQMGIRWRVLFASTMSGSSDQAPSSAAAEPLLLRMVDAIRSGAFANMIAFDMAGDAVSLG